jgi:hypothetical protein
LPNRSAVTRNSLRISLFFYANSQDIEERFVAGWNWGISIESTGEQGSLRRTAVIKSRPKALPRPAPSLIRSQYRPCSVCSFPLLLFFHLCLILSMFPSFLDRFYLYDRINRRSIKNVGLKSEYLLRLSRPLFQ